MDHPFEEWIEISPAAQNEMAKSLSGIRSEDEPSLETFEIAKVSIHSCVKITYKINYSEAFTKFRIRRIDRTLQGIYYYDEILFRLRKSKVR